MDKIAEWMSQNPTFIVCSYAATFIGLIIAVIVPFFQRRRKLIGYYVATETILSNSIPQIDGLSITYNGEAVDDLYISRIHLINSGNVLIDGKDFYNNHRLTVSLEGGRCIDARLKIQSSDTIETELNSDESTVVIDFNTLERSQYADILVYHTGAEGKVKVTGKFREGKLMDLNLPASRLLLSSTACCFPR